MSDLKIRVAIGKQRLLEDLGQLRTLLAQYCALLEARGARDAAQWQQDAAQLLTRHGDQLAQANLSLHTMDLAGAVVLQVLTLQPGEQVTLLPIGSGPALPDAPPPVPAPESVRDLIAEINALSAFAPLALQERLRFLLGCLMRLDGLRHDGDEERTDAVLAEINVLTSGRASQALVREIALLARGIYNSIDALSKGLPLDSLSSSADGISEAVRKIRGVLQRLEQAATQNLDLLERVAPRLAEDDAAAAGIESGLRQVQQRLAALKEQHPAAGAALDHVRERLSDSAAATVMQLRLSNAREREMNLKLISNQSFQDLTGQTLKKIITFVENLQMQLMALLEKYQTVLTLAQADSPLREAPPAPAAPGPQQSQDQVDSLLAKLGF